MERKRLVRVILIGWFEIILSFLFLLSIGIGMSESEPSIGPLNYIALFSVFSFFLIPGVLILKQKQLGRVWSLLILSIIPFMYTFLIVSDWGLMRIDEFLFPILLVSGSLYSIYFLTRPNVREQFKKW